MDVAKLHEDLLAWSESERRDLPWRRTRDPWPVLVSELMLQQTQVARVIPKFEAFVLRFPTPADCARAPVAEVIELWAGLGYNRRAVNLHRCARLIATQHAGSVPDDLSALLELPGIGPYTARAVLAFAFERDVGVVDTNVARVLARWAGTSMTPAELQNRADDLVPPGEGWAWNQALFDLGASSCRAKTVTCASCCVREHCAWGGSGPDPATRSARQSTFEGSDRQGRGRLVDAMRVGSVRQCDLASVMGWPQDADRAMRVAHTLIADGLAVEASPGTFTLPAGSELLAQ